MDGFPVKHHQQGLVICFGQHPFPGHILRIHRPEPCSDFLGVSHSVSPSLQPSLPFFSQLLRWSLRHQCDIDQCVLESLGYSFLVSNSFLLLVVRPGAPSSVLAPSSDARSPYSSVIVFIPILDILNCKTIQPCKTPALSAGVGRSPTGTASLLQNSPLHLPGQVLSTVLWQLRAGLHIQELQQAASKRLYSQYLTSCAASNQQKGLAILPAGQARRRND